MAIVGGRKRELKGERSLYKSYRGAPPSRSQAAARSPVSLTRSVFTLLIVA